jgi:hypothetical protein
MKRRIKQLIAEAGRPKVVQRTPRVPAREPFVHLQEIELGVKADVLAGRLFTYAEAAKLLGCSAEKMRLNARGFPLIRCVS